MESLNNFVRYIFVFITAVLTLVAFLKGGNAGALMGKSIVTQIGFLMEGTIVYEVWNVLFLPDFPLAIASIIGLIVGGVGSAATVLFLFLYFTTDFCEKLIIFSRKKSKTQEPVNEERDEFEKYKTGEKAKRENVKQKKKKEKKRREKSKEENTPYENTEIDMALLAYAYNFLGLNSNSTNQEVISRYRRLAKIHHPDKGGRYEDWHTLEQCLAIIKHHRKIETT